MKKIILASILFFFAFQISSFAGEPIPSDSFIEITGLIMDKFDLIEGKAKHYKIDNQLDEITALFKKYQRYTSVEKTNDWPEGKQKIIVGQLNLVNFDYMIYSTTREDTTREDAEKSLQKARELFGEYIQHVNKNKK